MCTLCAAQIPVKEGARGLGAAAQARGRERPEDQVRSAGHASPQPACLQCSSNGCHSLSKLLEPASHLTHLPDLRGLLGRRESDMRKAHESYLTQVERDARKRDADRKAEEERLRRNEVLYCCLLSLSGSSRRSTKATSWKRLAADLACSFLPVESHKNA